MNRRAIDSNLLIKVKLNIYDIRIIKSLTWGLEANKDNKEMVLTILAVLMVLLMFAENPNENADKPEKFRNSLKKLNISNLSRTIVSTLKSNVENK